MTDQPATYPAAFDGALATLLTGAPPGLLIAALNVELAAFAEFVRTVGSPAAEDFLECAADRLRQVTCTSDGVARVGSGQFVVLLESVTGLRQALDAAEAVRAALSVLAAAATPAGSLTSSIGLAMTLCGSPDTAAQFLARAAAARQQAQWSGGDRITVDSRLIPVGERSMGRPIPAQVDRAADPADPAVERSGIGTEPKNTS